jgi:dihydrofolate reductase
MNRVIVIEFTTLDGVVEDPDGSGGTAMGGWAFRHGPETVGGDKFRLGPRLETGTLLLGRVTWELFARIWPSRTDPFATAMNRMPKAVLSRTLSDAGAWANSTLVRDDPAAVVTALRERGDVVVTGSLSVVRALAARDLVDEYRLLVLPTLLGSGRRLLPEDGGAAHLRTTSVDRAGAAVLVCAERDR